LSAETPVNGLATAGKTFTLGCVVSTPNLGWLVWDKMERGRLFLLPDSRCWAGPVTGQQCVVCEQRIEEANECEVAGPDGPVFAHLACHTAWSRESYVRRERSRPPAAP
jgi:hypothetical protein